MREKDMIGRVMLVDDEAFDQMFYERILLRSGMVTEIFGYTDAREAVAHLDNPDMPAIDLILLDIRMPVMDGFEFLEAAAMHLGPDTRIPVVFMLTTSLSPDDKARAEENPCVSGYLNKPLTQDNMIALAELVHSAKESNAAA